MYPDRRKPLMLSLCSLFLVCNFLGTAGCGSGASNIPASVRGLLASGTSVNQGSSIMLAPSGVDVSDCTWSSSTPAILTSLGGGKFLGVAPGNATVSAHCGPVSATTSVLVKQVGASAPIQITHGGTYSGIWASTDSKIPAISVLTDEPVTIQNSTVSGPGDLISINGSTTGAKVTIDNVTGTALDPKVLGLQRGRFIVGSKVDRLSVTHSTAHGASLAVLVGAWNMTALKIVGLKADGMEDRASDGKGGLLSDRPTLGHFIAIARTSIPSGAEIAWNQMIDVIGATSVEDAISLYDAVGSAQSPISVHDNYLEGGSSAATTYYTGAGILTDGPGNDGGPEAGFITITNNQIVHTAGGGVGITAGHDVHATGNRVVSCGQDSSGQWFAMPFTTAIAIFNYTNSPNFMRNSITQTQGGLLRPTATGAPMVANMNSFDPSLAALGNSMDGNQFTDPCLLPTGKINMQAEAAERALWQAKISASGQKIGDQH